MSCHFCCVNSWTVTSWSDLQKILPIDDVALSVVSSCLPSPWTQAALYLRVFVPWAPELFLASILNSFPCKLDSRSLSSSCSHKHIFLRLVWVSSWLLATVASCLSTTGCPGESSSAETWTYSEIRQLSKGWVPRGQLLYKWGENCWLTFLWVAPQDQVTSPHSLHQFSQCKEYVSQCEESLLPSLWGVSLPFPQGEAHTHPITYWVISSSMLKRAPGIYTTLGIIFHPPLAPNP